MFCSCIVRAPFSASSIPASGASSPGTWALDVVGAAASAPGSPTPAPRLSGGPVALAEGAGEETVRWMGACGGATRGIEGESGDGDDASCRAGEVGFSRRTSLVIRWRSRRSRAGRRREGKMMWRVARRERRDGGAFCRGFVAVDGLEHLEDGVDGRDEIIEVMSVGGVGRLDPPDLSVPISCCR